VGWVALGQDVLKLHAASGLEKPGSYRDRKTGGEYQQPQQGRRRNIAGVAVERALNDMAAAHLLQRAIAGEKDELYDNLRARAEPAANRGARPLELVARRLTRSIDESNRPVAIVKRFSTGAMSRTWSDPSQVIASANVSWASGAERSGLIAPVEKRLTMATAGSTSSIGTGESTGTSSSRSRTSVGGRLCTSAENLSYSSSFCRRWRAAANAQPPCR